MCSSRVRKPSLRSSVLVVKQEIDHLAIGNGRGQPRQRARHALFQPDSPPRANLKPCLTLYLDRPPELLRLRPLDPWRSQDHPGWPLCCQRASRGGMEGLVWETFHPDSVNGEEDFETECRRGRHYSNQRGCRCERRKQQDAGRRRRRWRDPSSRWPVDP